MRKTFLLLIHLVLAASLWGKHVPVQQAEMVAVRFMCARTSLPLSVQSTIHAGSEQGGYYIVDLNPQGWVIISADDVATPVIGYSATGSLDINSLPDNMSFMMDEYDRQITAISRLATTPHPFWASGAVQTRGGGGTAIEPLIQVNWDQSDPYNVYCPGEGSGKAVVGCAAVSMSQAMSVQRYPDRPRGKVSYTCPGYGGLSIDFDTQRAYNWNDILSGADNYDEAARLMYHAGMSVHMIYDTAANGGSGTSDTSILGALHNHFGYSDDVRLLKRDGYSGNWTQMLLNELNAGRAVVYNAGNSKTNEGHSFNLDGYDGEERFHVNWGWGGHGNGYFTVDNLRDGSDFYDAAHSAVIGIGAPDQILKNIELSNTFIEEKLQPGAVIGKVSVNGAEPLETFRIEVHGVYNSNTGGYEKVPFALEDGMLVTTEALDSSIPVWEIEITVEDTQSQSTLTQGFHITVLAWSSIEKATSLKYDRNTRAFLLRTKHNVSYSIISADGRQVQSGLLEPLPELSIPTGLLTPGENTIELKCGDDVKRFKIVM